MKSKWEEIDSITDRLKVPGGWIYRTHTRFGPIALAMVFVSDPKVEIEVPEETK